MPAAEYKSSHDEDGARPRVLLQDTLMSRDIGSEGGLGQEARRTHGTYDGPSTHTLDVL